MVLHVEDKVRWLTKYQTAQPEEGTDGKLGKAYVYNSGTCLSLNCIIIIIIYFPSVDPYMITKSKRIWKLSHFRENKE
jgi:hypothetical protein